MCVRARFVRVSARVCSCVRVRECVAVRVRAYVRVSVRILCACVRMCSHVGDLFFFRHYGYTCNQLAKSNTEICSTATHLYLFV